MGAKDDLTDFDYAVYLIGYKVRKLVGLWRLSDEDREDIEQELILQVLQKLSRFDSNRGATKTFINCILDNRIRQILDKRKSLKSGFGKRTVSLDECFEDKNGCVTSRADVIDREEYLLSAGILRRPIIDECELRMDIEQIISELTPELRELCKRLQKQTVTEISEEMGVPRHSLYPSIRKLRCIFEGAGLKDYL